VVAVSAQEIYFLSNNGSLYKTDTAGTWSASIPLPAGLSFNENTKLYKDLNNRLWIYGRGQIARFNPASNTWTLLFGSTGYKNNVTIEGMAVDAAGNIWTIADNEVRRNATELNVSGNNNFSSIAFAPGTNRIWITADNRSNLYYATPTGNQITSVTNAGIIGGADNISVAGDGSLFFTSAQSIISANSNGVFIRSYNIATTGGLLTGNPDDYSLDNEGNIWVVQGGRLIKIPVQNPGASRNYSYNSTLNGFSSLDIIQISGTDNDIFLTKTTGNAAIHIK
jgi:sugar lactone lactonase YvrE